MGLASDTRAATTATDWRTHKLAGEENRWETLRTAIALDCICFLFIFQWIFNLIVHIARSWYIAWYVDSIACADIASASLAMWFPLIEKSHTIAMIGRLGLIGEIPAEWCKRQQISGWHWIAGSCGADMWFIHVWIVLAGYTSSAIKPRWALGSFLTWTSTIFAFSTAAGIDTAFQLN